MKLPVSKYHGCGNDFLLARASLVRDWPESRVRDLVIQACDRHTGIGADGFIFAGEDPFEMIYYNQDGSRADMCGNGIRCLSRYYADQGLWQTETCTIETLAGTRTIRRIAQEPFQVQVNMGKPLWETEKIAVPLQAPVWEYPLEVDGQIIPICSFYMNTIHTVVFVDDPFSPRWEELGQKICEHSLFAEQTNVNFVQVLDENTIRAATYERGCGMTLACGTGMCAAAVTCRKLGRTGPHVDVLMKRGTLHIDIEPDETVLLSGPAALILEGDYDYDEEAAS